MVVLAAAMLRGGTSNQQRYAEAFVEAELAKHDKDVSDRLTEKLKETVKLNEDGVWVSMVWEMACSPKLWFVVGVACWALCAGPIFEMEDGIERTTLDGTTSTDRWGNA